MKSEKRWSVYFSLFGKGADKVEWEYFLTYSDKRAAERKAKLLFERLVGKGFDEAAVRLMPVQLPAVPAVDPMPQLSSLIALATVRRQMRQLDSALWGAAGICHSKRVAIPNLMANNIYELIIDMVDTMQRLRG